MLKMRTRANSGLIRLKVGATTGVQLSVVNMIYHKLCLHVLQFLSTNALVAFCWPLRQDSGLLIWLLQVPPGSLQLMAEKWSQVAVEGASIRNLRTAGPSPHALSILDSRMTHPLTRHKLEPRFTDVASVVALRKRGAGEQVIYGCSLMRFPSRATDLDRCKRGS